MFPGVERMEKFLFYELPEGIVSNARLVRLVENEHSPKNNTLSSRFSIIELFFILFTMQTKSADYHDSAPSERGGSHK